MVFQDVLHNATNVPRPIIYYKLNIALGGAKVTRVAINPNFLFSKV